MRPAMNAGAHFRLTWRAPAFVACGLVLVWLVLSRSLSAFLADTQPQAALWLDSSQPEALTNLADQALTNVAQAGSTGSEQTADGKQKTSREGVSQRLSHYVQDLAHAFSRFEAVGRNVSVARPVMPDNHEQVQAWAEAAVTADPLNARALRTLGQLAEAGDDDLQAEKFLSAAGLLSRHDSYSNFWLMRKSFNDHDYKSAVHYADILLRSNPQSSAYVVPFLAQISEDKAGAPLIKTVLADNPPWRKDFFAVLPRNVTDPRTPLDLLLSLQKSTVPPATEDLSPYIDLLVARKFYGLAYYTWLQFLSPQQLRQAGLLYNGSFETSPSGLPFDWKITPGSGVTVDIVPRSDRSDRRALLIDFQYGRVDYHSIGELVMLAPGSYEFKGAYKGRLVGPRGLKWRIVCANGTMVPDGESPMIMGFKDWQTVAFRFEVPDKDCPAQYVQLDLDARTTSEHFITGSILFDDLQIARVANTPAAASKAE